MQSESYHHLHFNSQPHKEADKTSKTGTECFLYFNSQPHKEADDGNAAILPEQFVFQLTASQGG